MTVLKLGNGDETFNPFQPVLLPGWTANSVVYGGNGDDSILATVTPGVVVYGGNGDDTVAIGGFRGGGGKAYGGNGDDTLSVEGFPGHVLDGGRGDDVLISASGPIGGGLPTAQGACMTGGQGHDTFVLDSRTEVFVFSDPDGTLSEGDPVRGIIDVIVDHRAGEPIDLPGTPVPGPVGTAGFTVGPNYLTTAAGEYGIVRGDLTEPGVFTVAADGDDLLLVYQRLDETDPGVDGAVAILGAAQSGASPIV